MRKSLTKLLALGMVFTLTACSFCFPAGGDHCGHRGYRGH